MNGSKRCPRILSGTPGPLSSILTVTFAPAVLAAQRLQQRACNVAHVASLFEHLLKIGAESEILLALIEKNFNAACHNGQRIVELVHEPGGELTQQRELVRKPCLPVSRLQ